MGTSRKFFVGGNWKCNGTLASMKTLTETLNAGTVPENVEVVVAPPQCHISLVQQDLRSDFKVAAQNCLVGKGGAFTGEVSAEMIKDLGLEWVILGHSERRTLFNETSEVVADKCAYALAQGLSVIACVGETLEEREAGKTVEVVEEQLEAISAKVTDWTKIVIAYEPVWAIGTGRVATPEQAQEEHKEIRRWLTTKVSDAAGAETRVIYGGSVSAKNCQELGGLPDIDGFLVGGASLKPEFIDVIAAGGAKA